MPVTAPPEFLAALRERGFDFFTGVPCSLVKGLLAYLDEQDEVPYLPATREDVALGVAGGAAINRQSGAATRMPRASAAV